MNSAFNPEEIKREILKLPVAIIDKLELYLVLEDLKPEAELCLRKSIFNKIDKSLKSSKISLNKTLKFVEKIGLYYKIFDKYTPGNKKVKVNHEIKKIPVTFFNKFVIVTKNKDLTEEAFNCWTNLEGLTQEINYKIGKLCGYPIKAVEAFSKTVDFSTPGYPKETPGVLSSYEEMKSKLKDCYWFAYTQYRTRKGFEYEDSLVAKAWADKLRKDFPELAEKFEKKYK